MDYTVDPCGNIKSIDFNRTADLKKILRRDKHTRVEGICTEAVFINDLVKESFNSYSTGWWFPRRNGNYSVVKILLNVHKMTGLDVKLLLYFLSKGSPTYIVSFDENEGQFFYVRVKKDSFADFKTNWNDHKKIYPHNPNTPPPLPDPSYRSETRLNKAFNILESLGMLKRAAIERLFANCWIRSTSLWDIDAFVMVENQIIAFEVKQKFPTPKNTFGLNSGLANLFKFLTRLGIRVVHVILTKPVFNKKISATDLYTIEKYKNKSLWIATDFSDEILHNSYSFAPAETSIFASQQLRYYHLLPN